MNIVIPDAGLLMARIWRAALEDLLEWAHAGGVK